MEDIFNIMRNDYNYHILFSNNNIILKYLNFIYPNFDNNENIIHFKDKVDKNIEDLILFIEKNDKKNIIEKFSELYFNSILYFTFIHNERKNDYSNTSYYNNVYDINNMKIDIIKINDLKELSLLLIKYKDDININYLLSIFDYFNRKSNITNMAAENQHIYYKNISAILRSIIEYALNKNQNFYIFNDDSKNINHSYRNYMLFNVCNINYEESSYYKNKYNINDINDFFSMKNEELLDDNVILLKKYDRLFYFNKLTYEHLNLNNINQYDSNWILEKDMFNF